MATRIEPECVASTTRLGGGVERDPTPQLRVSNKRSDVGHAFSRLYMYFIEKHYRLLRGAPLYLNGRELDAQVSNRGCASEHFQLTCVLQYERMKSLP